MRSNRFWSNRVVQIFARLRVVLPDLVLNVVFVAFRKKFFADFNLYVFFLFHRRKVFARLQFVFARFRFDCQIQSEMPRGGKMMSNGGI